MLGREEAGEASVQMIFIGVCIKLVNKASVTGIAFGACNMQRRFFMLPVTYVGVYVGCFGPLWAFVVVRIRVWVAASVLIYMFMIASRQRLYIAWVV